REKAGICAEIRDVEELEKILVEQPRALPGVEVAGGLERRAVLGRSIAAIEAAEAELSAASEAALRHRQAIARGLSALGCELAPDATVAEAGAVLSALREVKDKLGDAAALQRRIDGMDRNNRAFFAEAAALAAAHAPDLADEPIERIAEQLRERHRRARAAV